MAQPWYPFDGAAPPPPPPTQRAVVEDDDLFNAALLFLDHHDDSHSDNSDSYSTHTTEDASPYQPHTPQGNGFGHGGPAEPMRWEQIQTLDAPFAVDRNALQVQLKLTASSLYEPATLVPQPPSVYGSGADPHAMPFDVATAPAWNTTAAPPAPTAPRRINKRRVEIERLKVESQSLENRLSALQNHSPTLDGVVSDKLMGEVMGSAWQNIASRQLEQRQRAEAENRRLKTLLGEHKRMAKSLRRLVARHANAKAWDQFRHRAPPKLAALQPLEDAAVFDSLEASLQTMYLQTDSNFASLVHASSHATNYRDMKTEIQHTKSLVVQLLGSRILPFGVRATADAVWECALTRSNPMNLDWDVLADGTCRTDFFTYTDLGKFKGNARGKIVIRRIDEPHRTVILRTAVFQCFAMTNPFLKEPMRHFMWTVIRKPGFAADNADSDVASQVLTCDVSMPSLDGPPDMDDDERAAATEDLVELCSYIAQFNADKSNEEVDNVLLGCAPPSPRRPIPASVVSKRGRLEQEMVC